MEIILKNDIDMYFDIGNQIDTRIRQLFILRDIVPFISEWFIKDNKIFVTYECYQSISKDCPEISKYKTIYFDLDYFLSEKRIEEWKFYEKIKEERYNNNDNLGEYNG